MKNKPVKCKDVFNYICDKLDADLNSPKCRSIKKHIDDCPNCITYLDSLKKTILLYKVYPEVKAPKGVIKEIFARLEIE